MAKQRRKIINEWKHDGEFARLVKIQYTSSQETEGNENVLLKRDSNAVWLNFRFLAINKGMNNKVIVNQVAFLRILFSQHAKEVCSALYMLYHF